MHVIISMGLAVLIWSLYPVAASIGLQSTSSAQLIFMAYLFAAIGAPLLAFIYLYQQKLIQKAFTIQKTLPPQAYIIIITSGIVGVLCHGSFIFALTLANKGGVSLLYESWPVFAIIATPFLMKKTWKDVSLKEFIISLIALVGVAIIILSDDSVSFYKNEQRFLSDTMNYNALGGYILAFIGAYMLALVVITKGVYSEDLKDDFGASMISEMINRVICITIISAVFLLTDIDIVETGMHLAAPFFVGFIVFVVGGALYTYSLLASTTPTFHILNYFVPVLAVIWLWIAGETTVNSGLFIGGGVVLACNAYLVWTGLKKDLPSAQA